MAMLLVVHDCLGNTSLNKSSFFLLRFQTLDLVGSSPSVVSTSREVGKYLLDGHHQRLVLHCNTEC